MPAKHVHFVDVPSPTFSVSSISSSSGPDTPPPMFLSPLSSKHLPPFQYAPAVLLHPLLARSYGNGTPLLWDMAHSAENALPNLPNADLTDSLLREPATNPPLPSLAIVCDYLPWMITAAPTPAAVWAQPFVTVGDVLHALYRALRLAVTEPEMNVLEPAEQDRVREAYVRRYRRIPDPRARDHEKAKAVKRIDFLREHRGFMGLSPVPSGLPAKGLPPGQVWALHVARP